MNRLKNLIKSVMILTCLFYIAGCSSSSYSSRYDKGESKEQPAEPKQNRFSSEDDPVPDGNTQTTYSNPAENEFDEIPYEDHPVDKDAFVNNYKHLEKISSALTEREKMLFAMVQYLDTPYKYGGNGFSGIDCSAFTQNIYTSTIGLTLPRTAREQYGIGESVNQSSLRFGDLVFFDTSRNSFPGHVGIYIGNDMFVHASSSLGVTISSLKSTYFDKRFIGGKRVEYVAGE